MTAATLSHLPLNAGGAIATTIGRTGMWTLAQLIRTGTWAFTQFMRAPITIAAIAAMAGLSLLAGSNALYFQTSRHPAPWFFAPPAHQAAPAPVIKPVIPATRPRFQPTSLDLQTTGSLGVEPAVATISNDDVLMLQKKLASLKLFVGTPDGMFGRRTASAIKAFQTKAGLSARGTLTREIVATIMAAPLPAAQSLPVAQPAQMAQPLPAAQPVPMTEPLAAAEPLPAAPPLLAAAPVAVAEPKPIEVATTAPLTVLQAQPVPLAAPKPRPVIAQPLPVPAPVTPVAAQTPSTFDDNSLPAAVATVADDTPSQPIGRVQPSGDDILNAAADTAAGAFDAVSSMVSDVAKGRDGMPLPQRKVPATKPVAVPTPIANANPAGTGTTTVVALNNPPARLTVAPLQTASVDTSNMTPAQKLAAQTGSLPPEATALSATPPATTSSGGDLIGSTDPVLITKIQRGLASLGFLGQKIDGVPGEGTAKAIRNFEVFYDYKVTGLATPQLLDLLVQHGAVI